jgi:hypothetical protein
MRKFGRLRVGQPLPDVTFERELLAALDVLDVVDLGRAARADLADDAEIADGARR